MFIQYKAPECDGTQYIYKYLFSVPNFPVLFSEQIFPVPVPNFTGSDTFFGTKVYQYRLPVPVPPKKTEISWDRDVMTL